MAGSEEELSPLYVSLHARCFDKQNTQIYRNILIYVPNLSNIRRQRKNQTEMLSVIVLGFDALSQMNLIRYVLYQPPLLSTIPRTLPKTWRLLRRHGAVLYEGLNRKELNIF